MSCLVLTVLLVGCQAPGTNSSDAQVECNIDPTPPHVGEAVVTLTLTDADGKPLTDAQIECEGNMNHAGMKPSFAEMKETEPGKYVGNLDFTMGGDWFLLVTAKTADGDRIERKFDVPGVKSQ